MQDKEDREYARSFSVSDNLNQNFTFSQPAGEDRKWSGVSTHYGETEKESTSDGFLTHSTMNAIGDLQDLNPASHNGSKTLDSFNALTVLAGASSSGTGYSSGSSSGTGSYTVNAVFGYARARSGPQFDQNPPEGMPDYNQVVTYDGYREPNYRDWEKSIEITNWVVLPSANIVEPPGADGRTWLDNYVIDPLAGFSTGLADGFTRVVTLGQFDISSIQRDIYGDEIADYNTSGYAYAFGHVAGTAAGAYVMAPIFVGAAGFTAGAIGATAATALFGTVGLGGLGYSVYQTATNWDQMSGPERLNSVGSMVAGIWGGSAGARNLPKNFFKTWETRGAQHSQNFRQGFGKFMADERGTISLDGRPLPLSKQPWDPRWKTIGEGMGEQKPPRTSLKSERQSARSSCATLKVGGSTEGVGLLKALQTHKKSLMPITPVRQRSLDRIPKVSQLCDTAA